MSNRVVASSLLHIDKFLKIPVTELHFRTARSRGPGGQNVNKLETRVELLFDVKNSTSLTEKQRGTILSVLESKMDQEGVLRIVSQESRSQWQNKQRAIEKFVRLLQKALTAKRERVATQPASSSKEKRLKEKKIRAEIKRMRKVME